jgi:hypothetical protein
MTPEQQRACLTKTRFPSRKNAAARARAIARRTGDESWCAYRCRNPSCRSWHLGHSSPRRPWTDRDVA